MPSRKFHGKSRHGCRTCKTRKVRCDLGRPICSNCDRLSRECIYVDTLSPSTNPAQAVSPSLSRVELTPGTTPPPFLPPPIPNPPSIPAYNLPVLELRLMHHFLTRTVYAQTDNLKWYLPIWQNVVPQLAFNHQFLLHGLLAVAALHLRHYSTSADERSYFLGVAQWHQQTGLQIYIPLLNNITEQNCHAVFIFSQGIAAIGYALISTTDWAEEDRRDKHSSAQAYVREILGIFKLVSGAAATAVEARDWLRAGPLEPMMGQEPVPPDSESGKMGEEARAVLKTLQDEMKAHQPKFDAATGAITSTYPEIDDKAVECYALAIDHLKPLLSFPPKTGTIIGWPVFCQEEYFSLLERRDDVALIILALYGVALHRMNHVWWVQGMGKRVLQSVLELVDPAWRGSGALRWAQAEVEKE